MDLSKTETFLDAFIFIHKAGSGNWLLCFYVILTSYSLDQGFPTPWLWTGTGPWLTRNQAAQVNEAPSTPTGIQAVCETMPLWSTGKNPPSTQLVLGAQKVRAAGLDHSIFLLGCHAFGNMPHNIPLHSDWLILPSSNSKIITLPSFTWTCIFLRCTKKCNKAGSFVE